MPLASRLDDAVRPLHVWIELRAWHEDVEVLTLEPVRGGQHVVGELTRGIAVEVDADEQVEGAQGFRHDRAAADAECWIAGDHDQRPDRLVGRVDHVGEQGTGVLVGGRSVVAAGTIHEGLGARCIAWRGWSAPSCYDVAPSPVQVAGEQ